MAMKQAASVNAGQLQHLFDDLSQPMCLLFKDAYYLTKGLGITGWIQKPKHLHRSDDSGQRGTQLMRNHGYKIGLEFFQRF